MVYAQVTRLRMISERASYIIDYAQKRYSIQKHRAIPVEVIAHGIFHLTLRTGFVRPSRPNAVGGLSHDSVLFLQQESPRQQTRYTIAHEIGHLLLHHKKIPSVFLSDPKLVQIFTWPLASQTEKDPNKRIKLQEDEADKFAAALLVPLDFLIEASRHFRIIDRENICWLASQFDVNPSVIIFLLKDLYENQLWEGPRIDWEGLDEGYRSTRLGKKHSETKGERIIRRIDAYKKIINWERKAARGRLPSIRIKAGLYLGTNSQNLEMITPVLPRLIGITKKALINLRQQKMQSERTTREPILIELGGTPNSGKDSLIKIITDYLSDGCGYRVRVIDESIKNCKIPKQRNVDRLYNTIAQTVLDLYEARYENPGDFDFIIFNRSIFDRIAMLEAMRALGQISKKNASIHTEYLLSYSHLIDQVFLLLISPQESIRREQIEARGYVEALYNQMNLGPASQPVRQKFHSIQFLETLNRAYQYAFQIYKLNFNNQVYFFDYSQSEDIGMVEKARMIVDASAPKPLAQLSFPEMYGHLGISNHSGKKNSTNAKLNQKRKQSAAFVQLGLPA
jgi:Zn-dependent peptidase ImmA (M78 family)